MYLCITPERIEKTGRIMNALKAGWSGVTEIVTGRPPDDGEPFIVWGQQFLALDIVPKAYREGRPFFIVDNGFWNPARGHTTGTYRITYRGVSPVLINNAPDDRCQDMRLKPWRTDGRHVLIAYPGPTFGACIGLDMAGWKTEIEPRVRALTDRPVLTREKRSPRPLGADLAKAHVLVTHSSNVAVDAVIAGVPVIVAETSPAAPVGSTDLADIETPPMPEREAWLASLSCQQFTLQDMASGLACEMLKRVTAQVDGMRKAA